MQVLSDEEFIQLIDESVARAESVDLATRRMEGNGIYRYNDAVRRVGLYVGAFQLKDDNCSRKNHTNCSGSVTCWKDKFDSTWIIDDEVKGLSCPA